MKKAFSGIIFLTGMISLGLVSCQKGNLLSNPNSASSSTTVPVSLLLNRITNEMYYGGGVIDGVAGNQNEGPWDQVMRWNQFFVSNYPYYWGNNQYTWTNTAARRMPMRRSPSSLPPIASSGTPNASAISR
jgi:hypothetical protein